MNYTIGLSIRQALEIDIEADSEEEAIELAIEETGSYYLHWDVDYVEAEEEVNAA